MKARELIDALSQCDPELDVVIPGYEGGVNDVAYVLHCPINRGQKETWCGAHKIPRYLDQANSETGTAILLRSDSQDSGHDWPEDAEDWSDLEESELEE